MGRKLFAAWVFFALGLTVSHAQNVRDLIIAEVLAEPDSTGVVDGFGRRSGWIELFNTSQGTVNFGGCFLTDDRSDLRKSPIPKGDLRTKLGPRQSALLFASGNGADGTFYAGFQITPGRTVYLVSNDGRTVIDSLRVPADLPAGLSISKEAHDLRQMVFEPNAEPGVPTPGVANGVQAQGTKAQAMAEKDPHGLILSLVSVTVVFTALAILWFLFSMLFRTLRKNRALIPRETPDAEVTAAIAAAMDMEADGAVYAAIAAALDRYFAEACHDAEPFVITIRREASAWNDKKQNFRKLPK